MSKIKRIFVAGHRGLIGSALCRMADKTKYELILKTRAELNLLSQDAVERFFQEQRPDGVILAAAKVGGIHANNTHRTAFLAENLAIQANVMLSAHNNDVKQFVFLGSSCIYPRDADQPIKEEALLTGPLEITHRPYALAKIAGLELINSLIEEFGHRYLSVMPTNLYGPEDNFSIENGHVLPALLHRFHLAKIAKSSSIKIWGTGSPLREFLHADDCADAIWHLLNTDLDDFYQKIKQSKQRFYHLNIGSGNEVSILQLAQMIKAVTGFAGKIEFDHSKPDGTPRKLTCSAKLQSLGWQPKKNLEQGLSQVYQWFSSHFPKIRGGDTQN